MTKEDWTYVKDESPSVDKEYACVIVAKYPHGDIEKHMKVIRYFAGRFRGDFMNNPFMKVVAWKELPDIPSDSKILELIKE